MQEAPSLVARLTELLPEQLLTIGLLFGLFVVPKSLQRFRIPSAVSSLALGATMSFGGWSDETGTVGLLASFGIVALFLSAGMEVEPHELRRSKKVLLQHLFAWIVQIGVVAGALCWMLSVEWRIGTLLALAIVTPSTGFILASLDQIEADETQRFWIKLKAVAAELVALGALFVVRQSDSLQQFGVASIALIALVTLIPILFFGFARFVEPFAPRSEFAFLLMVAVVCAYATKKIGVYYLVGAFLVGVAAQQFRGRMPAISSERIVHATEAFASVFIPFYFFYAGLSLRPEHFTLASLGMGLLFVALWLPMRIGFVALHRRLLLGESTGNGLRLGVALSPTLVFTLVLAKIVTESYDFPMENTIFGALILYTIVNTMLPSLVMATPVAEYETLHLGKTHRELDAVTELDLMPGFDPAMGDYQDSISERERAGDAKS
jgi:Kef-type K+ transport system membrane component KefB